MTTANLTVIENVLFKRGNTAVTSAYTGVPGEIVVDTTLKTLRVQDGITAGGTRLATHAELANVSVGGNVDLSNYATIVQLNAVNANVSALQGNAIAQALAINTINANIANVAPSLTNGVYQLKLQANGNVTVPSGTHFIVPENGNIALRATGSTGNAHVEWHNDTTGDRATVRYSATGVEVYTTSSGVQRSWLFHPDGSTHFPQYTFPLGAGAPDSYLKSDGFGTLNWVTTYGNLIPAANVTYSLGNSTNQWKELWVSNNTIYIGGVPLSVNAGGQLLVGGNAVAGGSTLPYVEVTNSPFIIQPVEEGVPVTVTAPASGQGATVDVAIGAGPVLESVTVNNAGTDYVVGQRYRVWHYNIGGSTDASGVTFTANTVGANGELLTITNAGFIGTPDNSPATYTGVSIDLQASVLDEIDTGVTLTRGAVQGLFNIESEIEYDNNLHNSPLGTEWNADGWDNLVGFGQRNYTTLRSALNNQIGSNIVGAELIMHDTVNDRYYKFIFSNWGQNNGGTYSYTRTEITDPNYFVKTDNGEEIDVFVANVGAVAGIGITRDANNGIYNPYREPGWDSDVSPAGTEWNADGWDDLSDVETRTYTNFYAAYGNGQLGNRVPGSRAVMYVPDTDKYYAIQWLGWTQGGNGGGFSYLRYELDLTKLNEGVKFADGTVLKSAAGIGPVKLESPGNRRIEEVYGYKSVSVTAKQTTNLTTTTSRNETNVSIIWIDSTTTTIDNILNNTSAAGIWETNTIEFSLDNTTWYKWNGSTTFNGNERGYSVTVPGGTLSYSQDDTVYFRYQTGGDPVVWWSSAELPKGASNFRGAVIDYHAFTGDGTIIGTIHIVDDDGEENITHTEVTSGSADGENDDLWFVTNEGQIKYRRLDGEGATIKVQWSARVFYGSEIWD